MEYNNNCSDVPRLSRKSPICWQHLPLLQDHIHQYCNTYIPNAVIILPNWLFKYPHNQLSQAFRSGSPAGAVHALYPQREIMCPGSRSR